MNLPSYISDLLFRYECVIVPNFGGFITNVASSSINYTTQTLHPPVKKITFNSQLKNNDGLLANYISNIEKISFEEAVEAIATTVNSWKLELKNETLFLEKIGTIRINEEQKIIFEPTKTTNYLTSSFGLDSCTYSIVKRSEKGTQKKFLEKKPKRQKKYTNYILKYAAVIIFLTTIGMIGWKNSQQQKAAFFEKKHQESITKKIQEATFIINNFVPEIKLNVVKKALPKVKKYHLIAGAFRKKANAFKKLNQLKKKGFDAEIVRVNKWGLTEVSYSSYATPEEARKNLKKLKQKTAKDTWLLFLE